MELGSWMDKCPKANEEHVLLLSFFYYCMYMTWAPFLTQTLTQ
jgi:hypothetical protein